MDKHIFILFSISIVLSIRQVNKCCHAIQISPSGVDHGGQGGRVPPEFGPGGKECNLSPHFWLIFLS